MGNRRVARTKMVLPVRVSGVDSAGKPFNYLAHTLDITLKGARLGGVRSLLRLGDSVEVQCRHRKARFRVAWVGRPGHSSEHQIGVESLENEKPIWGLDLVDHEIEDTFVAAGREDAHRRERRGRNARIAVAASIEIRHAPDAPTLFADVTDVSSNGCYVQCEQPLKTNTQLGVRLMLEGSQIDAMGVVRTCHPKVGMGIEFTEYLSPADETRYASVLERLSAAPEGRPTITAPKPDGLTVSRRIEIASRELDDISELLKSVDVDPLVLREFRGALSHVRATAWAVQRWIEIHSRRADPFPVLAYINVERLHLATNVCRGLCTDMQSVDVTLPKKELEELLHAVEELFSHLWIMDFNEGNKQEAQPPKPKPAHGHAASARAAEGD